jgi:hypothetical protein
VHDVVDGDIVHNRRSQYHDDIVHVGALMTDLSKSPAETDASGQPPAQALRTTVRGLSAVVGPSSLVLALLYYFGWVRTSYQAHELGLDDTLLGYSTQDYILRSITALEGPLLVGMAAVLAALGAHRLLLSWIASAQHRPERQAHLARLVRLVAGGVGLAGAVLSGLGLLGARVTRPSRFVSLWAPLALTAGIALLSYAVHLFNRYAHAGHSSDRGELSGINLLAAGLMSALLLLAVLRAVSHYAAIRGIELARSAEMAVPSQPDVTLYSVKRLALEPDVTETKIQGDDAAYHFKYTGLKLLFRSDGRYFLRPVDTADGRNIIISDTEDLRFEFAAPR